MYNLHLSAEQLEIRDTVRDFVTDEIKPVVLKADRLDVADRTLPFDLLDKISQMGLRTLALSEDLGGAGADHLTACIVTEELAAGDADIAAEMTETSRLGHILFDQALTDAQRDRFLPAFLNDDRCHLAFADREPEADTRLGVNYHRAVAIGADLKTIATKASNGDWIINGVKDCVANAPIAKLFVVTANVPGGGVGVFLVPSDAPGLTVRANNKPWRLGPCGEVAFKDCKIVADNVLEGHAGALFAGDASGCGNPLFQALNIGIGRAAHEAAVEYAHIRVQGGRTIVEHQAIATKLADNALRLEMARGAVWRAAWASDHPEAVGDRSVADLPLQLIAQVYTSEAMVATCKDACEVFGAMGVMRDMPLQKYLRDARMCLHADGGSGDARLRIAEALIDYRHPAATAVAAE
jgi:alkylation response protein AidB-like acyl-CoA dehydrogenase